MKVVTKELYNDIELHEIHCALDSIEKRTLPLIFLNGNHDGVADCDIKTVKTQLNVTDKENEISFIILPASFTFFNKYFENALDKEKHSPEDDFFAQYINRLKIISYLPEEILKQVKDKRLLALGYAEKEVKKAIIKYVKEKKTAALMALKKSIKNSVKAASGLTIENQFGGIPNKFSIEELFEKTNITSVIKKFNNVYIRLDNKYTIVLTDAEILEEEIKPENTCIQFFELYKVEQSYELHFLLSAKDSNLIEYFYYVTYRFKDMQLI